MTIQVKCDKCERDVRIADRRGREVESHGYYFYALFTLLGKNRNYTLCEKCEKLFTNWLKGETIDKQTKPQE